MGIKYVLVQEDFVEYRGCKLYRIKALKDFGDIKRGQLGGYIESYENLSQEGLCWVFDGAYVYGDAKVIDNAKITGITKIHGQFIISRDVAILSDLLD